LADIHLAPMIGYFAMAVEGDALVKMQCELGNWWSTMSARTAYRATKPRLPAYPDAAMQSRLCRHSTPALRT
jgi:glutathione S-transferase